MNEPAKNPRLSCRVIRRWAVLFDSAEPLKNQGFTSRHVGRCEDCRKFYTAANDLDALLRTDARSFAPARADLADDIISALRENVAARETVKPRRSRQRAFAFTGAAMLAAALAIAFVAVTKSPAKNKVVVATPEDVHQTLLAAQDVSQKLWASLKPSAVALTTRDPLNEELNSVVADARSAVNFLALNFVPDAAQKRTLASPQPREGGA